MLEFDSDFDASVTGAMTLPRPSEMPSLSALSLVPTFAVVGCMPGGICTAMS